MSDWASFLQWFAIGFLTALLMIEITSGAQTKAMLAALLIVINLLSFFHRNRGRL